MGEDNPTQGNRDAAGARRELARAFAAVVGEGGGLAGEEERLAYDVDGFTLEKHLPDVVVLPRTTQEVSAILALAHARALPVTPRGAGTGLAGGAHPAEGGLVVSTARMDRILAVEPADRFAVVQPGVVNLHLSQAAATFGLHYATDQPSQLCRTA